MASTTIKIGTAVKTDARQIAPLIMEAMNLECCQNWAGPNHTLDDFLQLMRRLVEAELSQYSYRNAIVARADDGSVAGVCVAYDGARLHQLREAFIVGARDAFGIDYSNIDDETSEGEFYIDSLAVAEPFRGHGIARQLLRAVIGKALSLRLPSVGLLVDADNPQAERLYRSVGFEFAGNSAWGGHAMRHLIIKINQQKS